MLRKTHHDIDLTEIRPSSLNIDPIDTFWHVFCRRGSEYFDPVCSSTCVYTDQLFGALSAALSSIDSCKSLSSTFVVADLGLEVCSRSRRGKGAAHESQCGV